MFEVENHSRQVKKKIADNQLFTMASMFEDFIHSRQAKKIITDNQRFMKVSMFEDFIFKPIFQKFSTFLNHLHIIKTTFRSPYLST